MQTKKLSLKSIKNVLSRAEMRNIMAGSSGCGQGCYVNANPGGCPECGTCVSSFGGNKGTCVAQPIT